MKSSVTLMLPLVLLAAATPFALPEPVPTPERVDVRAADFSKRYTLVDERGLPEVHEGLGKRNVIPGTCCYCV